MHAELLGGVEVQKISRHRGLYRAGAGSLLIEEQNVVVRAQYRELHFSFGRVNGVFAFLEAHEHRHFSHTVEVDVVGADELIYVSVLAAPEILPLVGIPALLLERRLSEGDRRPEGLRPYPDGQRIFALKHRSGNAPLNVACKSERNKGFTGAVAYSVRGEYLGSLVHLVEFLELDGEAGLFLFLYELVLRKLILDCVVAVQKLVLDVHHWVSEEL